MDRWLCPFLVIVTSLGLIIVIAAPLGVVAAAAKLVEQRWTEAVHLVVERAGIGEILDLAEHFDPDAPMLGEVIFAAPAIFEAKAFLIGIGSNLLGEQRIEGQQERPLGPLDDRTEPEIVGLGLVEVLVIVNGLFVTPLERKGRRRRPRV